MSEAGQMVIGLIVIGIGFLSLVSYPSLQYRAIRQMRGAWFGLGLVPLAVMAVVLVLTGMAAVQGSNLWPILLIFTTPLATAYLVLLRYVARYFDRDDRTNQLTGSE